MKRLYAAAAILLLVAASAPSQVAKADTPTVVQIAIPADVLIDVGAHVLTVIGRPNSPLSPVHCAPLTPQPQTVLVVEPGGGRGAQTTGVLVHHEHEVPLGARYRIVGGPNACNADWKLYTAERE